MDNELDSAIRLAAFRFLEEQVHIEGDVLPRSVLQQGFEFRGQRVPLAGPQGIFKPAVLDRMPLTITTAPPQEGKTAPYEDEIRPDGFIGYRYRGTDPQHRENVGLREAMQSETPLIYLHGIVRGQYLPVWPVYVVGDDPSSLTFTVAVDDKEVLSKVEHDAVIDSARRAYVTRLTRHRLHQAGFRQRVIRAYQSMCAICRLRHEELLDAAHIVADSEEKGIPVVSNGMALCKLHHAAFDQNIIGVRPDLVVQVSMRILSEIDGPMLKHGLQGFHGSRLSIPRRPDLQPDVALLTERFDVFSRTA